MQNAAKALLFLVAGALFASTTSSNPKTSHKPTIKHPATSAKTHKGGGKGSLTPYGANSSHAAPSPGKAGSTGGAVTTVGDNSETAAPSPTGPGFSGTKGGKGGKGGGSGKGSGSIKTVGDNSETAAPSP